MRGPAKHIADVIMCAVCAASIDALPRGAADAGWARVLDPMTNERAWNCDACRRERDAAERGKQRYPMIPRHFTPTPRRVEAR